MDEAATPPDVGFISILKTRHFAQTRNFSPWNRGDQPRGQVFEMN